MTQSSHHHRPSAPRAESGAAIDDGRGQATSAPMASRPPPLLLADAPGLDFLNSLAVPADEFVEWIGCGDDLLAWLELAGLVPQQILEDVRARALPGELDAVAGQARTLREWFRNFVVKHKGAPLQASALAELEPLNAVLARDESFGRIVARPQQQSRGPRSGLAWRVERRWRSPDALLLPIARTLADLVCEEDFARIKGCAGADCVLYFIDRTRSGSRRWCSMAICGNRAKQSALRARQREDRECDE